MGRRKLDRETEVRPLAPVDVCEPVDVRELADALKGLADVENGRVASHADVARELRARLKKS